jgi:hypothetical protein
MSLNQKNVADRIISQLPNGIDRTVGTEESHTVQLIRIIVKEVFAEIQRGTVLTQGLPVITSTGQGTVTTNTKMI